jgi:hypothetical protein
VLRARALWRLARRQEGQAKKGKLQIVYGLLCAAEGCPVAVEAFAGNTADPMTLSTQVDKLKQRFGLSRVVLVGDRGMITSARIRDELVPGRARLDHRAQSPADPGPARRRRLPTLAV